MAVREELSRQMDSVAHERSSLQSLRSALEARSRELEAQQSALQVQQSRLVQERDEFARTRASSQTEAKKRMEELGGREAAVTEAEHRVAVAKKLAQEEQQRLSELNSTLSARLVRSPTFLSSSSAACPIRVISFHFISILLQGGCVQEEAGRVERLARSGADPPGQTVRTTRGQRSRTHTAFLLCCVLSYPVLSMHVQCIAYVPRLLLCCVVLNEHRRSLSAPGKWRSRRDSCPLAQLTHPLSNRKSPNRSDRSRHSSLLLLLFFCCHHIHMFHVMECNGMHIFMYAGPLSARQRAARSRQDAAGRGARKVHSRFADLYLYIYRCAVFLSVCLCFLCSLFFLPGFPLIRLSVLFMTAILLSYVLCSIVLHCIVLC